MSSIAENEVMLCDDGDQDTTLVRRFLTVLNLWISSGCVLSVVAVLLSCFIPLPTFIFTLLVLIASIVIAYFARNQFECVQEQSVRVPRWSLCLYKRLMDRLAQCSRDEAYINDSKHYYSKKLLMINEVFTRQYPLIPIITLWFCTLSRTHSNLIASIAALAVFLLSNIVAYAVLELRKSAFDNKAALASGLNSIVGAVSSIRKPAATPANQEVSQPLVDPNVRIETTKPVKAVEHVDRDVVVVDIESGDDTVKASTSAEPVAIVITEQEMPDSEKDDAQSSSKRSSPSSSPPNSPKVYPHLDEGHSSTNAAGKTENKTTTNPRTTHSRNSSNGSDFAIVQFDDVHQTE